MMKQKTKKGKRIIALILCLILTLQFPGPYRQMRAETVSSNAISAEENTQEAEEIPNTPETSAKATILDAEGGEVEVRFEADFNVEAQWENAYNGTITLFNPSDKTIENWILSFETTDVLGSFYNAIVSSQQENVYVIKNCGWNRDIAPGESISFGFTGRYEGDIHTPSEFKLLSVIWAVEEGVEFHWSLGSAWEDGYTGEMSILNTT